MWHISATSFGFARGFPVASDLGMQLLSEIQIRPWAAAAAAAAAATWL